MAETVGGAAILQELCDFGPCYGEMFLRLREKILLVSGKFKLGSRGFQLPLLMFPFQVLTLGDPNQKVIIPAYVVSHGASCTTSPDLCVL